MEQYEGYLRVTAVAISGEEDDPARERIVVDCFVGSNWLLTVHDGEIAVLDDFRATAEGKGNLGLLDAPSFLAVVNGDPGAEMFLQSILQIINRGGGNRRA